MNTEKLFKQLHSNIPLIKRFAIKLTEDFETARFLYQETTHQAIKNKQHLREETLNEWLMTTMENTYSKIVQAN
jgi:DNA-directed RNA polymerase specialized sigma24 family protein